MNNRLIEKREVSIHWMHGEVEVADILDSEVEAKKAIADYELQFAGHIESAQISRVRHYTFDGIDY